MAERCFGILQLSISGRDYKPLEPKDLFEIFNLIGLDVREIQKIQPYGPNPKRIDVLTKSLEVWHRIGLNNHIDKVYTLSGGKVVEIVKPYEEQEEVRVKRIPIIWGGKKNYTESSASMVKLGRSKKNN